MLISIKNRMKKIREEKKKSLHDISKETGIEEEYLRDMENNLPADEILLVEAFLVSRALNSGVEDVFECTNVELKKRENDI